MSMIFRKKKVVLWLLGISALWSGATMAWPPARSQAEDPLLHELMDALGRPERADIKPRTDVDASIELGKRIVHQGILSDGRRQSRHFVCTSCHNTVQETADLRYGDPDALLAYAQTNGLPLLPGTTLYGAVDREQYYNGDYEYKYGELVADARDDLRAAVQLCATQCSQGRALGERDMESVIMYLRTIGIRLSDLQGASVVLPQVGDILRSGDSLARSQLVNDLRQSYALFSPATFEPPPPDRKKGYATGEPANLETGESLYKKSCLYCHKDQRYSFFELDESSHSKAFLSKHFPRYTRYSTYQVARYGTSPIPGKRAYMPHYTAERMSGAQLESLRAYLEEED